MPRTSFMKKTVLSLMSLSAASICASAQEPVDYVNPYMGNISHVLKPTYPTVQLPNSMLRVFPRRADFADMLLEGLPLANSSHRSPGGMGLEVYARAGGLELRDGYPRQYAYDREKTTPYSYEVFLEGEDVGVKFAPAARSAIYEFDFSDSADGERLIRLWVQNGSAFSEGGTCGLNENLPRGAAMHLAAEFEPKAEKFSVSEDGKSLSAVFPKGTGLVRMKYGISFIDAAQAKENLEREMPGFDLEKTAQNGRKLWNEKLSKIKVDGSRRDMEIFYTSLWRTYERMVDFGEYGRHYNPFDGKVHESGEPFYADDWIWDTYLTVHPLRILIEPEMEAAMLSSYIKMARASKENWLPTFPQIWGDAHAMNGNHAIVAFLDAQEKGLKGVDFKSAYEAALNTLETETITPWVRAPANELDAFYKKRGYFPALREGERETVGDVNRFERRQAVAVTLGASCDDWALSRLAALNGDGGNAEKYSARAKNYENLWNAETKFFHPRDRAGKFIEPFDYRFSGGMGFRDYYDENNGHTYRWNLAFDIDGLVKLMGGAENFAQNLDGLFTTPLGKSRQHFHVENGPDQTGNIGQFAMGNEPSFHIPYLYNHAGMPWKTQKTARLVTDMWFRNDLMGVPGDEDGGAMSAYVVFTMLGIYPTSPGKPFYDIGSPYFKSAEIDLGGGKSLKIVAKNAGRHNKYVQSAKLNGREFSKPQIAHKDIAEGGVLEFEMGEKPNREWGLE